MVVLTTAYILHVISAAFWTGATLYVVYAVLPAARTGQLAPESFTAQLHRLLLITRWTGLVLPVTGAYMIWVLYTPLDALVETQRGLAVLAMLGLWGIMNTLIEVGVLQTRRLVDDPGMATYMADGFPTDILPESVTSSELAERSRPYLLASAGCALLLLVDAALLAGGIPW